MAMDFDSQLIESVEVRRNRLSASFLFGLNPTERRWKDRTNSFVYGLIIAALICAFCVALSFVINILTNYINDRNEREQQREQQELERQQMEQDRQPQGTSGNPEPSGAPVSPAATALLASLPVSQPSAPQADTLPPIPWTS
ncbi:hypothetical protein [Citricoccus alkalitolerans]|uniref:Uncharacterized protein n=1 Tax=Citricoccus alkalitolerans TaxID=246603 RepID=A0ABV8XT01_9MICC